MDKGTVEIHGVTLKVEGDMVAKRFLKVRNYEPVSFAKWAEITSKGGLVVDIGAYTGLYAIAAAQRGCEVWAFDINENALQRLQENARLNGVTVNTCCAALYSLKGREKPYTMPVGRGLSPRTRISHKAKQTGTVVTKILNDYDLRGVAAIKVDTEKTESDILIGGYKIIERDFPIIISHEDEDRIVRSNKALLVDGNGYVRKHLDKDMFIYEPSVNQ